MNMIKKSILTVTVSSFSLLASLPVFAAETTSGTTSGSNYVLPGQGGNAADSARSAEKSQLKGAVVNVGAAAMFGGICATVYGGWACAPAAIAMAAAGLLNKGAKGSGAAGASMSAYDPAIYGGNGLGNTAGNGDPTVYGDGSGNGNGGPTIGGNGNGPTTLPDGSTAATVDRSIARVRQGLADAGVIISGDGKTLTTKDGRKYDLSKGADGTTEGMLAMGLTASEAAQAEAAGKNFAAQAAKKYASLSADGGGGGGSRGPAADAGAGGAGAFNMNGWGNDPRNKKRAPAKVSGLTRKLGDDTIGVSGDNIFEMVTRRYKARDENGNFIKD